MAYRYLLTGLGIITGLFSTGFSKVLLTIPGYTVTYPKGKIGGKSAEGLPGNYVGLPPAHAYYLDYRVYFTGGFAWVKGGKLPGLVGGTHTSGCKAASPGGWSARCMWRRGGWGEVYLYDQNRVNRCGDDYPFPAPGTFAVAHWNRITEHVVVNTPGRKDGKIEAWLNGVLQDTLNNVELRGDVGADVALVDQVSLETFYGGGNPSWAPPQDMQAQFSAFYVRDDLPDFSRPFGYDAPAASAR